MPASVSVGGDRRPDSVLAAPGPFSRRLRLLVRTYLDDEEASCRQAVADRAVKATNGAMWRELDRRWSTEACAHLDRLASRLEADGPEPGPVDLHAEALAEDIGVPSWVALHVGWIAAAVSADPVTDRTEAAAAVIRAFGIAVCVEHDMTARCPCLLRGRSSAGAPERGRGGSRLDPPTAPVPAARNDRATDRDAQAFFDALVEAVLKGIREATTSLAWETLNEAVARDLDAQWEGSIVAALNGVASALDALREGLQEGADTVARFVLRRSGLPPWAQRLTTRLAVSLAGLPVNTQLHVAALGIRLFGACLEVELSALSRAIPAHELADDPRVRPVLEDLWDYLEPLHVKEDVIDLLVRFDYGDELIGVLEPLREPSRRLEPAPHAEVETPRSPSALDPSRAPAAHHEIAPAPVVKASPLVPRLELGPEPLFPELHPEPLLAEEPEVPPPMEEPGSPLPVDEPGLPRSIEEPEVPLPMEEPGLPRSMEEPEAELRRPPEMEAPSIDFWDMF